MATLPMYQQQTRAQAPTATGADFGAGAGQALAQGGDVLAQIGERMQARSETINRVRVMNQFEQQMQQDMVDFQNSDDFTDPASISRFKESSRERREAALSSFSGRPGSRDTFRSQLENMEGQYIKSVTGEQIKAGQVQIAQGVEKVTTTLGSMIVDDPSLYNLALQNAYEELNMLQPGMSEQAYSNAMLTLDRTAANAMVQSLGQRGEVDELEKFLSNEQNRKLLDTRTHLSAQADISKVRYEREQSVKNRQKNVKIMENLGVRVTEDMMGSIPDVPMKELDSLNLYQSLGGQITDNIKAQAFGFNLSPGGKLTQPQEDEIFIRSNIDDFASGNISLDDARKFDQVWTRSFGGKTVRDRYGNVNTMRDPAPLALQDLYLQGMMYNFGETRFDEDGTFIPGKPTTQGSAETRTPEGQVGYTPRRTGSDMLEGRSPTGPIAAILTTMGKGSDAFISPDLEARRTELVMREKNLVTTLQENPKFAEGERVAIAEMVNIAPRFWDSPKLMAQRFVVMNDNLKEKLYDYHNAINDKSVPQDVREGYEFAIPIINSFVRWLDMGETDVRRGGLFMGNLKHPQTIQNVNRDENGVPIQVMLEDGSIHNIDKMAPDAWKAK